MNLSQAKTYAHYAIKYGYAPADVEEMTNKELIAWAEEQGARGDYETN